MVHIVMKLSSINSKLDIKPTSTITQESLLKAPKRDAFRAILVMEQEMIHSQNSSSAADLIDTEAHGWGG